MLLFLSVLHSYVRKHLYANYNYVAINDLCHLPFMNDCGGVRIDIRESPLINRDNRGT